MYIILQSRLACVKMKSVNEIIVKEFPYYMSSYTYTFIKNIYIYT